MTPKIRRSCTHKRLAIAALCLLSLPTFKLSLAQTLDPETGKSIEILGIESERLQAKLESRMIKMLNSDDFDGMAELVREYPMVIDEALMTDFKLVYRMKTPIKKTRINATATLPERLSSLAKMIDENDQDDFLSALEAVPELRETIENSDINWQIKNVMLTAVRNNNIELITWLHENCPHCAVEKIGHSIMDQLFENGSKPWKAMNADTFRYVYELGAAKAYLENSQASEFKPSIVVRTASYWIPEKNGLYGDYSVNEDDREFYDYRLQQKRNMLSYLFTKGHSVNETEGKAETTAFFNAVDHVDIPLMDFLIGKGVDFSVGRNPMGSITGVSDPDLVERLVAYGYDPKAVAPSAYSSPESDLLLNRIVESRRTFNPELMKLVDDYALDVNAVDKHGKDPLAYAAYEFGQTEQPYTEFLLARGVKKSDSYYYAALLNSIRDDKAEVLSQVLELRPALAKGLPNSSEITPIELSVRNANRNVFDLLIEKGATLPEPAERGTVLLETLIYGEHFEFAQHLIDLFPDIQVNRMMERDGTEKMMSQALAHASSKGNMAFVNLLLDRGASLDGIRMSDFPIFGPALNGHVEIVRRLLEAGSIANPAEGDKSVIQYAEEYNNDEIVKLLKEYESRNK